MTNSIPELGRLSLNDDLAVFRTTLANERTLLAFLRTALQCLVGGVTLLEFFDRPGTMVIGQVLVGLGLVLAILGVVLFVRRRRHLALADPTRPSPRSP